jgi:hypothetical protein
MLEKWADGAWRPNERPGDLLSLEQRVSNTFRIEE